MQGEQCQESRTKYISEEPHLVENYWQNYTLNLLCAVEVTLITIPAWACSSLIVTPKKWAHCLSTYIKHRYNKISEKILEMLLLLNSPDVSYVWCTLPLTDVPIGRGLTVTVPFKASSRTLAEIVVLIGTPSLLKKINNKSDQEKSGWLNQ